METTKEEALRAKENAEKLFAVKNFCGAKDYALKAQKLCPELESISQMVATFEIYTASEVKINGEIDFYSILGLEPSADKAMLKKQYRKMAVLLHPDRTKLWELMYEYLWKYVNKIFSCKNCRGVFIAVDTGAAPINSSFPYCAWSNVPDDRYRSHGYGVTYVPTTSVYFTGNGVSGLHSGHGSEYASNASLHWSSCPGAPTGVLDPDALSTSADVIHLINGKVQ
ncbi:unnamed protein product [Ilex paraguariensis]|uniref:J domain-containing protein n=1 Tax=Ilex paraguariensis TaxID=185542 RepID=A0ABC8QL50_9AQUA